MRTSIFELFKIGIGPSSSHTVGPMRSALAFVTELDQRGMLDACAMIRTELYGSLALTGKGHGTDTAILLGLSGEKPEEVDPDAVNRIRGAECVSALGRREIASPIVFHREFVLPGHPNAMRFTAFRGDGAFLFSQVYYSIGGGFIQLEGAASQSTGRAPVPHPFGSAHELLRIAGDHDWPVWRVVLENEKAWRSEAEIRAGVTRIWAAMMGSMERGLCTEGILPGGLNVRRRAPRLARRIETIGSKDPLAPLDWVNVFAIAVNEENAAGGRVVTAPTNGAAGIIPAVGRYYQRFIDGANDEGLFQYFLTAGAIGILYKENASISGAEVGCQGEVGVACSMAAGGLVAAIGGTNDEIENAAEIGMEHNLGMTCDPIGGLVQIPCIERNAFGAVKAVNAARMSVSGHGEHKVSLDQVIETMYRTGMDMQSKYKETSLGGLAVSVVEC
jgi:L-serine dehydratase